MCCFKSFFVAAAFISCFLQFGRSLEPCEEYTDKYRCENETTSYSQLAEPKCEDDFVETTISLMDEGDVVIDKLLEQLDKSREAVLLIGNTGTGKSTLAYFVAGNDTRMISYKQYGEYRILDCNGKIGGSSIISETMFPDLVIQDETQTAFFDYPGFLDTRTECVEIANAYFMLKVAQYLKKVKIVMVMNNPFSGSRDDFPRMLKSVINFIPSITKLGSSVCVVATKISDASVSDDEKASYIKEYLEDVLPSLKDTNLFVGDELVRAEFLVKTLTDSTKIGVFRTPNECGLLSEIPFMQENKQNIQSMISDNVQYTATAENDFAISLSSNAKLALVDLKDALAFTIPEAVETLCHAVYDHLFTKYTCRNQTNCEVVVSRLELLYGNNDFNNGYSDMNSYLEIGFKNLTDRLLASIKLPELDISKNISDSLSKSAGYIDFLKGLDSKLSVDIVSWLKPFQDLKTNVTYNVEGTLKFDIYDSVIKSLSPLPLALLNVVSTKFYSSGDIIERNHTVSIFADLVEQTYRTIKSQVEADAGVDLGTFINNTIENFKTLGLPPGDESLQNILEQVRFVNLLDSANIDTKIKTIEQDSFLESYTTINSLLSNELSWCQFLINLYGDLSAESVQVKNTLKLKEWWKENGNIEMSDGNDYELREFWEDFGDVRTIIGNSVDKIELILQYDRSTKLSSLNTLLNTTLEDIFSCKTSSSVCTCEGNYMSLRKVVDECRKSSVTSIVLKTYHTVFIDYELIGYTINNVYNVDVIIVSPKWSNPSGTKFNLNGQDGQSHSAIPGTGSTSGKSGNVGGKAGNFFGVGDDFSEFNTFPLSVTVDGGHGGDGQRGQQGTVGKDAVIVEAPWAYRRSNSSISQISEEYCMGWNGGLIRIRKPIPNSCSNGTDDRCSHGVHYINSIPGTSGGNGGNGGKLAQGGSPGHFYFPLNGIYGAAGILGRDGSDGLGGAGGIGGNLVGRTKITIWSYYDWSAVEYLCKAEGNEVEYTTDKYSSGSDGLKGLSGNPAGPIERSFDPNSVKPYIIQFKTTAQSLAESNEFFKFPLNKFVAKIDESDLIPFNVRHA